jgi:hypothetical protein
MMELGPLLWILDRLQSFQQTRRRVRVLVHQAVFFSADPSTGSVKGSAPHYFVKVTNLSPSREIEITHVWFDAKPPVHLLIPERPLPARLRPDATWEGWVNASALAHASNIEQLGRVRLASGKVVKSRRNKDVPPVGYVAGPGTR